MENLLCNVQIGHSFESEISTINIVGVADIYWDKKSHYL